MQKKLIVSNPKVMMGKPVIAGTRITVEIILEKLSAGETVEQILEAHPVHVEVAKYMTSVRESSITVDYE